MKIRKFSISTAITAIVVVLGIITTFATSAAQDEDENKSVTLSQGNTDISAPDVEWWTYEEYAEWLENEKVELQNMIGERGWTGGRGEFVWTQEIVDETIAMYESILENIKNGMLYSKTIDGEGDLFGMMSYDPENIESEINDSLVTTTDFAPYEPYGLVWDESEKALFLNGQRVRYFLDGVDIDGMGTMSIRLEYADADFVGEIDVHTIRQRVQNTDGSFDLMGPLTGLEKYSQAEYDFNTLQVSATLDAVAYTTQEIDRHTEEMKELLQDYTPFGLSYETDPTTGELNMSWQGKPVHSVFDEEKGVWIANNQNGFNLGSDAVDLEAVYEQGTLTGLRDTQNHSSHNSVFVEQEAIAGDPVSDNETDSWLAEYEKFGVTYDKINNQWYFNGERVRRFMDILTSNGEKLNSGKFHGSIRTLNGNGTVDIHTIRDFDNLNSEGNGTLIDVKAYSQEEFDEYTKSSSVMIETP